MTQPIPLSCFIIAKNEEERIGRTIAAVKDWVDDIVVVDSGSTDRTQQIAESLGARVIFHEWQGYGQQKRFAETQCRNDWLLNLDADEVVSEALGQEIQALFATGPDKDCYRFRIRDVLPGDDAPRPFAYAYNVVRLYDGSKMRYADHAVHDRVETGNASIGQLSGAVHHFSYLKLSDLVRKNNNYTDMQAEALKKKSIGLLKARLWIEFPLAFMKYYFGRLYILAGAPGLSVAVTAATFRFLRIAKMIEKHRLDARAQRSQPD